MTSRAWVPKPAAHISVSYLDDEAVLYDAVRHRPILLNHTAGCVWAAIDGRRSFDDVVATIAEQFGVESGSIVSDVESTVLRFVQLELVVDDGVADGAFK
jgi:hypothetical protein